MVLHGFTPWGIMHHMETIVNNAGLHILEVANRVDFKSPQHKQKKFVTMYMMDVN